MGQPQTEEGALHRANELVVWCACFVLGCVRKEKKNAQNQQEFKPQVAVGTKDSSREAVFGANKKF